MMLRLLLLMVGIPIVLITDRIRTMREGDVFSPRPGPDGGGGTPAGGGHLPRVPPGQGRMGGTPTRGVPIRGAPWPGQDGGGPQPGGTRPGYHPHPPPRTGQHMEYLISGGRYASCVHAGGLSCCRVCLSRKMCDWKGDCMNGTDNPMICNVVRLIVPVIL